MGERRRAENDLSFSTFRKFYQHIPERFWKLFPLVLMEGMVLLVLAELINQIVCGSFSYSTAYFVIGSLALCYATLYIGKHLLEGTLLKIRKNGLTACDALLLLMLLWSAVSTVLSPDPFSSYFGSGYRKEGFSTYLVYAAFFLCARQIPSDEYKRIFLKSISIVGSVLAVWFLISNTDFIRQLVTQWQMGKPESDAIAKISCFANPNHFAYFLTMVIMSTVGLFLTSRRPCGQTVWLVVYAINLSALIRNQSQGGYLAVGLGIVFLLAVSAFKKTFSMKQILVLLAVFVLISALMQYDGAGGMEYDGPGTQDGILETVPGIQQGTSEMSTLTIRFEMWERALEYISQRPIFGFGPDGSGVVFFDDIVGTNDRPHNEYLQYGVYLGIPGLMLYLSALVSLFIRCVKNLQSHSVLAICLGGMVFGYCVSAFFGNTMYYTTIFFVCYLGMLVEESAKVKCIE